MHVEFAVRLVILSSIVTKIKEDLENYNNDILPAGTFYLLQSEEGTVKELYVQAY